MKVENEKVIYSIIRETLFSNSGMDFTAVANDQWECIFEELEAQTISCLPVEWILKNGSLSENVRIKWTDHYMWYVNFYYQLLFAQNELVQLMLEHQIPVAILKGVAAATYYPQPSARMMGDVDFLVPEDRFDEAYALMLDKGYHLMHEEDTAEHHIALRKGAYIFELHRKANGLPKGKEGEDIHNLISEGLKEVAMIKLDGYQVPILPALQNGLVLFFHMVGHFKKGLGFRQIIDWMLYVNEELCDDRWYHEMQPILKQTGYETFAKVITRMCQLYLGLGEENITWCKDVEQSTCEKLMTYIEEQGNFGRKVREEDQGIKILERVHNPIQLFKELQERGKRNWKVLDKYPALHPFAWLYTSCKYIQKASRDQLVVKKAMSDIKEGNKLRELYDELGI